MHTLQLLRSARNELLPAFVAGEVERLYFDDAGAACAGFDGSCGCFAIRGGADGEEYCCGFEAETGVAACDYDGLGGELGGGYGRVDEEMGGE